jgi:hypothetical protein
MTDITGYRRIVGLYRNAGLDLTVCPFPTGDSHLHYRFDCADRHSHAYRRLCADRFYVVLGREILAPWLSSPYIAPRRRKEELTLCLE